MPHTLHHLEVFQTRRHLAGARHTWRTYRFSVGARVVGDLAIFHGKQRGNAVQLSNWAHGIHRASDRREAYRLLRHLRRKFCVRHRTRTED